MKKKPFTLLNGLAGAFHCRTDEDKVKLLSVLSNNGNPSSAASNYVDDYDDDDEDDQSSTTTAAGGPDADILSTSSSLSAIDGPANHDAEGAPATLRIDDDDLCLIDEDDDRSIIGNNNNNNGTVENMNLILDNKLMTSSSNTDDHNHQQGAKRVTFDDERRSVDSDNSDNKFSSAAVINGKSESKTGRSTSQAPSRERCQQEWTFTLYDFDAKGKVTKEDILSLVRSIYEVLATAKIPKVRSTCHQHDSSNNNTSSADPVVGAFKIKLAVIAPEDLVVVQQDDPDTTTAAIPVVGNFDRKMSVVKTSCKTAPVDGKCPIVDKIDRCDDDADDTLLLDTAEDRLYEQIPLIRRRLKKATKRHHENVGKTSTSPIPYGKLHRRSQLFDNGAIDLAAACCTYRDYVNLSEVENCCSNGGAPLHHHHHQHCHQQPGSNKCVHHIRHCDRHCHCPAAPSGGGPACNDPCLTMLENEYERLLQKKISSPCCPSSKQLAFNARLLNLHNYRQQQQCHHAALNERARAYYSEQRVTKQQHMKSGGGDCSAGVDSQDAKFPAKIANLAAADQQHHAKRHRNREKDKLRAMQQVREWILNDAGGAAIGVHEDKSTVDDHRDVPVDHNNPTTTAATSPVVGKEPRGEAGGGCSRLVVEHKHSHEHHHFHHF